MRDFNAADALVTAVCHMVVAAPNKAHLPKRESCPVGQVMASPSRWLLACGASAVQALYMSESNLRRLMYSI